MSEVGKPDLPGELMRPVERFDPQLMGGQLLAAEHLARYQWASALVEGKRVLDAGCGTGYGADLLAAAGAREVVGVDIDREAFAKTPRSAGVTLVAADVRAIPHQLGEFDVIVCFEVIEHLEEPDLALDGLTDALASGGLLIVSSPNRAVYPPGNPYHKHEYLPEELRQALEARLAHVRLVRQQDWLATALFESEDLAQRDAVAVPVAKDVAGPSDGELYTVALASNEPLPATMPFVMLTQTADLKWWQEVVEDLRAELDATRGHVAQLDVDLSLTRAEVEAAVDEISAMKATRVWRFGTSFWAARDRILGPRRG